jgi:hypothetical protein
LEYNTVVFNPSLICLVDLIEDVQRNFTKRIPSLSSMSYSERLAAIDLEPLELRRLRFDLILYYKVFNNLTPFAYDDVFITRDPPAGLRSSVRVLQKPIHATNKLLSTLFFRCIDAWNSLPVELKMSSSLAQFKRGVKHVDLSTFLKGSAWNC